MKKIAKSTVPIIIYELLIILIMYGADNNLDMYFLLYVPYQYFLCSIYAFFVGRVVQKLSTVTTFLGRMMFAIIIVLLTLYNNYLWFYPDYVLRDDTNINVSLSFIGFLIGEIYQYNKQKAKNE